MGSNHEQIGGRKSRDTRPFKILSNKQICNLQIEPGPFF